MARANPDLAMRPFLPQDTAMLAEIFRHSVGEFGPDYYSEAQCEAWASTADDEAAFGRRLGEQLTLVATMDGAPVGFASLKGQDGLDMLYVHPAASGRGAGSMLVDALEKLAAARGAGTLTVDASDSAEEFFRHRGYAPHRRNSVLRGDEWLANTTMQKPLAGRGGGS